MTVRFIPEQINLVVRDIEASVAFYRLLGWEMDATGPHASIVFPNGFGFDLDQHEFAKQWNSGTPDLNAGSVVVCVTVPERDEVDVLWQRLVDAGYGARQMPYDAFWGSRFAVIDDPDGYQIGLRSPRSDEHRFWPPSDAPRHPT